MVIEALAPFYAWTKALHLISVFAWMAGLFYLPRLYVYHTQQAPGSAQVALFKTMERRLLRLASGNIGQTALWARGAAVRVPISQASRNAKAQNASFRT